MNGNNRHFPYKSILVVCSVNTARSPMTVGYLRKKLADYCIEGVNVCSGGIASNARDGMLISIDAKLAMEELGVKLSDISESMDLKRHLDLIEKADLILTLTEKHKEEIQRFNESDGKKILTLKEFAGENGDIFDPSMKGIEGFRIARDLIVSCVEMGFKNRGF